MLRMNEEHYRILLDPDYDKKPDPAPWDYPEKKGFWERFRDKIFSAPMKDHSYVI